jgi:hypothetical protein
VEVLGVDVGGVIIDLVSEDRGRDPAADFAAASPVAGAFESIGRLVERRFAERVWLVSRCDAPVEPLILAWLDCHEFFRVTGVARERVRFCRERHDKAAICRELGVTHFVDDRHDVLGPLVGVVAHPFLLQSRGTDPRSAASLPPSVARVTGWSEIVAALSTA